MTSTVGLQKLFGEEKASYYKWHLKSDGTQLLWKYIRDQLVSIMGKDR